MKYENRTKHPLPAKILLSLVPLTVDKIVTKTWNDLKPPKTT
ncbi:unnamed protein product [Porites lobata]|uniref:Cytochrome b n=1 Tax=Porites lobata TaxID=104759 RepID=A0ABN8QKZ2_9CNID|nr:unnamed protein product [Porites lobata]